ncbi:class I SAM-dependent methyltransferase [Nocardioides sp. HDW12B]|nr:class I SAM-dependent methyltransferase [Nocardioides sp. HDW12B]
MRERHGADYAHVYAAHFDELAATGTDVHGEVAFLRPLLGDGARVLDAGCGTGRVAQRLAEEGYDVTGVDADPAMVDVARERAPGVTWVVSDLADLDLATTFELVVMAGNVVPFVEADLDAVCARLSAHLAPRGLLVCGYGLDADHLPEGALEVPFATYDAACSAAGLHLVGHHAGWEGQGYDNGGYSLSVHVRPDPEDDPDNRTGDDAGS